MLRRQLAKRAEGKDPRMIISHNMLKTAETQLEIVLSAAELSAHATLHFLLMTWQLVAAAVRNADISGGIALMRS